MGAPKLLFFYVLVFSALLTGVGRLYAQAPPLQWTRTYGGTNFDGADAMCSTLSGGYALAGFTYSNGGDIDPDSLRGVLDFWVVKTDGAGTLQWQACFGGSAGERASAIAQTKDSGFIIAGFTDSEDGDVTGNHGGTGDAWLVKTNATGAKMWAKCYGGSLFDLFNSVIQTNEGGYIAVGGTASTELPGHHGGLLYDYFVVKLDDTGGVIWQKCLGGTNSEIATRVIQTADSGYLLTGYCASGDGDVTVHYAAGADIWVVRLDKTGALQWQKTFGGNGLDAATDLIRTANGYLVAGNTTSSDGDVTLYRGGTIYGGDAWVFGINDTGKLLWQRTYGGTFNDLMQSAAPTAGGGYVLAGWTGSPDGDVHDKHDTIDAWIIKINDTGAIQWQRCLGGSASDVGCCIVQNTDNSYVMAGTTSSSDLDVARNQGLKDMWLLKLGMPSGLPTPNPIGTVHLYPNPGNGIFHLEGYIENAQSISVTDVLGRRVWYTACVAGALHETITLPGASPGVYSVCITSKQGTMVLPICVQ